MNLRMLDKPIDRQAIKPYGFTLIELMVTIAIAAILMGLAAPSFSTVLKNNRMTTKVNDLVVAINIARQTAVSRGDEVFVCHSANADDATPSCGGSGSSWAEGILVYATPENTIVSTARDYAPATDTLIYQAAMNNGSEYTVTNSSAASYVGFSGNGLLFPDSNTVSISLCDDRIGDTGKTVSVTIAGRISTDIESCT